MIENISPTEAWKVLQSDPNTIILDVRSQMEFKYVGHPHDAINVPWKEPSTREAEPYFVDKVKQTLRHCGLGTTTEEHKILSLCRSGARSKLAGELLLANGFKHVLNISKGFEGDKNENKQRNCINGWCFHGLPWEQS